MRRCRYILLCKIQEKKNSKIIFMEIKKENRKRIFLSVVAVILTACLLFLVFRIFLIIESYLGKSKNTGGDAYGYRNGGRPEYLIDGEWYIQKDKLETFLIIGIDKYEAAIRNENGYRNTEQSDALFLLAVDRDNETYSIIHINRDTMANIRMLDLNGDPYNSFEGQLALSHTYGSGREDSCQNTVWSVSDYLYGLQIDHYASLSMDAVAILNDEIGGVTLSVLDDMTVIDKELVKGKTVTLRGNQSLNYVRSRQELVNSTNLERMKRQRQYVTAFLEQANKALSDNSGLSADMLLSVSEYLITDLSAQEILALTDIIKNYKFTGIEAISGEAHKGEQFMEFYADETALKELVIKTFYEKKK